MQVLNAYALEDTLRAPSQHSSLATFHLHRPLQPFKPFFLLPLALSLVAPTSRHVVPSRHAGLLTTAAPVYVSSTKILALESGRTPLLCTEFFIFFVFFAVEQWTQGIDGMELIKFIGQPRSFGILASMEPFRIFFVFFVFEISCLLAAVRSSTLLTVGMSVASLYVSSKKILALQSRRSPLLFTVLYLFVFFAVEQWTQGIDGMELVKYIGQPRRIWQYGFNGAVQYLFVFFVFEISCFTEYYCSCNC